MARFDLSGKVALVAGASRGIGEAIAHGFAEHGATVVCSSRKVEDCQKVADAIVAKGGKATAQTLHLGEINKHDEALEKLMSDHGRLDIGRQLVELRLVLAGLDALLTKLAAQLLEPAGRLRRAGEAEAVVCDLTEPMLVEGRKRAEAEKMASKLSWVVGDAMALPFEDNTFDMATAYSCLDHLINYDDFFAEAYRVLKPGGILYVDLNPNRFFWQALENASQTDSAAYSQQLQTEIFNTLSNDKRNSSKYGIDIDQLVMAEPTKNYSHGFDAQEIGELATKIGFSKFEAQYHWFLTEGVVLHQQSAQDAKVINDYLQTLLPVTKDLFKYVGFILEK